MGVARSYLTLVRWLGPWASEARVPVAVRRRRVHVEGEPGFDAWLYVPRGREPVGAFAIAPGLHYAGPADPRMNRFCSVLACAGITVLAPFIPDYTALRVTPRALADFERALRVFEHRPEVPPGCRPGVFSISFGSLLALRAAALPEHRGRLGALLLFGGYADWDATIRFCLTGEIDGRPHTARDPLNQPVVFMNLIDTIEGAPSDPRALLAGWRRYVEATWGRPEMKVGDRHVQVARAMARELPAADRELFLIGCGALPGGYRLCAAALERSTELTEFLDPRPHLASIRCPVHLVHGIEDDVIPYVQSEQLAAGLPAAIEVHLHLTGLYGHTAKSGNSGSGPLARLPALARELVTMSRIVGAMIAVSNG